VDRIRIVDYNRHFFHKLCIGKGKGSIGPFESLDSIMHRMNHTRLAVLKMDIEGSEYEVNTDEIELKADRWLPLVHEWHPRPLF
jgi:hypothetical protein